MEKNKFQFGLRDIVFVTLVLAGSFGMYTNYYRGYDSEKDAGSRREYENGIMDTLFYWEHHEEPSYDRQFTELIYGEKYHNHDRITIISEYNR